MIKITYTIVLISFLVASCYGQDARSKERPMILQYLDEKCTNFTGNSDHYIKILQSMNVDCTSTIINDTAVYIEASELFPLGRIQEVTKKTCLKQDALFDCFNDKSKMIYSCLTEEEISNMKLLLNIVKRIMNYACGVDGDIIATFFNDLGPECFELNENGVKSCVEDMSKKYEKKNLFFASIFQTKEMCGDLKTFQTCLIPVLKKCEKPTISNLGDGFFKSVLEVLSC